MTAEDGWDFFYHRWTLEDAASLRPVGLRARGRLKFGTTRPPARSLAGPGERARPRAPSGAPRARLVETVHRPAAAFYAIQTARRVLVRFPRRRLQAGGPRRTRSPGPQRQSIQSMSECRKSANKHEETRHQKSPPRPESSPHSWKLVRLVGENP